MATGKAKGSKGARSRSTSKASSRSRSTSKSPAAGRATKKKSTKAVKASGKGAATRSSASKKTTKKATARASKPAATKSPAKRTATKRTATKQSAAKQTATKETAAKQQAATRRARDEEATAIRPAPRRDPAPGGVAPLMDVTPEVEPESAAPAAPSDALADQTLEDLWVLYRGETERLAREGSDQHDGVGARRHPTSERLDELRNELIERHYPLVRFIAERLLQTLPKSIELDDLVSAGQFGLMDAIRGFDPDRGIKFKTYCSTRIRGSILDQLRSQDWVPRLVRLKASKIDRALQELTGEFGREPTHAELAKRLEMENTELVCEIQASQAKTMFSLSEKWDDEDEGSSEKVEVLEDRTAIDPVNELNRRDLMTFITRSLTYKEKFIIEQYYKNGHTMREIGEMLTLTESRVCQIHSNVMGRLQGLLAPRDNSLES